MKKRILASALAVCMLFGSAAALPEGFLGESTVITASAAMNPTYVQLSDGNYRLKSCTGSDTSVTLASTYNGKTVTEVGNNGVSVFAPLKANTTLQQVVVPSSYTTIGASAFYNCTALGSVTLNSGLKTIGNYAFENCSSLTSITIPSTVTSIASNAFNGCTAMTSINVASGSSSYSSSDGVLYNKAQTALIAVPAKKTSINVPGTVQTIPSMAFSANITSVTLNEGTKTLEKWAFINCKNLTSITIPASVTSIGQQAVGYYHANGESTDPETKKTGFVIKGYTGSAAESYAKNNGFTFQSIGTSCTHTWGTTPSWTWDGISSAKATFTCTKCGGKQDVNASITNAVTKAATCSAKGVRTYTAKVTVNGTNYTNQKTADIAIDSNAHSWNTTASWTWNGYTSATAKVTCKLNSSHTQSAAATITSAVTKAATCAETGVRTYTAKATIDGKNYTDTKTETIPKDSSKHVWGTTASWTWNGYSSATAALTCSKCGSKKTATATITNAVTKAATCAETGVRTYTAKATIDGKNYTDTKTETIPKDSSKHVWGTTASWTWNGYSSATAALTCSKCGSKKTATATITNAVTKAATCAETGVRTYTAKATIDGKNYTDTKTETIPKDSSKHVWGTTPSWTWNGYSSATATLTCSKCGGKLSGNAKITSAVTKAATCSATGVRTYTATATVNGKSYTTTKTETIPVNSSAHSWGSTPSWTWSSDNKTATAVIACVNNASHTQKVTVNTTAKTTAATCTAAGKTVYTAKATIGGKTYTDTRTVTIPALGHKWGDWRVIKQPTETTLGAKERTCTRSGCSAKETDSIPVTTHTHTYKTTVVDPTVTTQGYTAHQCTGCSYNYRDKYTPKLSLRICGSSRYETSMKTADQFRKELGKAFDNVIIASGADYADALSASYLAKVKNAPILLVANAAQIMDTVTAYVKKNAKSGATVYIVGGTSAVPAAMETKLKNAGMKPVRLAGDNRYETNIAVLKEAKVSSQELLIASGLGYADALSGSAVGLPIMLVGKTLTPAQVTYLKSLSGKKATIIGGTGAVSEAAATAVGQCGKTVSRLGGATRYETSLLVAQKYFQSAPTLALAYGLNFPDGLCGGALAMKYQCPLLLATTKNTSDAQKYAKSIKAENTVTFGGTPLISDNALKTILSK